MKRITSSALLLAMFSLSPCLLADTFGTGENQFTIEFVTIGNPGNRADTTGNPNPSGAVPYAYRMGKYEISREMVTKANAEGNLELTLDPMTGIPGGPRPQMPAAGVSWNEAARFVNWLNTSNGFSPAYKFATQPGEVGYDSNENILLWQVEDAGFNVANLFRNSLARYVLPSVHEWYKAAYYDPNADDGAGGYWNFPTGSDTEPTPVVKGTDPGTAVYGQCESVHGPADINDAGGLSSYGVMALGGNVTEWEETEADLTNDSGSNARGSRGGYWLDYTCSFSRSYWLSAQVRDVHGTVPTLEFTGGDFGFRVVSIPEPSAQTLAVLAILGVLTWRRIKSKATRSGPALSFESYLSFCPARKSIMREVLLFTFVTLPCVAYSQTVYDVVPRELGNGYSISEGGKITVIGGDITAWEIPVLGELSFTFSSTSRMAELFVQNVEITASAITVPAAVGPGPGNYLSTRTQEFFPPSCVAECFQFLDYFSVHPRSGPFAASAVSVTYDGVGMPLVLGGESRIIQPVDWVVATVVPEPKRNFYWDQPNDFAFIGCQLVFFTCHCSVAFDPPRDLPRMPRIESVVMVDPQPHESAPSTIWYDDFDDDSKQDQYAEKTGEATTDQYFGATGKSLRMYYPKGKHGIGNRKVFFGDSPTHLAKTVRRNETFQDIYWRIYVKHPRDWTGGGPAKLSRATSLVPPGWRQAMIAHVWSSGEELTLDPASGVRNGQVVTTRYNDFKNLRWLGNKPTSRFKLHGSEGVGWWVCVEARAKLNTPEKKDGENQLWIDGRLEAERQALDWRGDYTGHGINAVFLEAYWNQGSPVDQSRWIDNLIISTEPIGPVVCPRNPILIRTRHERPGAPRFWRVEVADDAPGQSVVWRSHNLHGVHRVTVGTTNGRFVGSLKGQVSLEAGRIYRVRVRQQTDAGRWSEWSQWHQPFRTDSQAS